MNFMGKEPKRVDICTCIYADSLYCAAETNTQQRKTNSLQ